jgi:hypothetical protein
VSERLELNDELLCAYMDGELDPEMLARVEQALVDDVGARVRLERMRVADERLKVEIPLPALQPNDPLSSRILDGKPVPVATRASRRWGGVAITALAAGISGVIVGFLLARSQQVPETRAVATTAPAPSLSGASSNAFLLAALDSGESGKAIQQPGHSAQVILTFEAEDGRYCRAFRVHESNEAAEGVACRSGSQWQVVAWDGTVDPDEGFRAAGASELLDDVMDRLGGGAALEAADERALIEQHWPTPPQR